MRYLITTALLTTALALPLGGASAQSFSGDVIARCNQAVGQMKFEGWPADRNREMMMLSCERERRRHSRRAAGEPGARCATVRRAQR